MNERFKPKKTKAELLRTLESKGYAKPCGMLAGTSTLKFSATSPDGELVTGWLYHDTVVAEHQYNRNRLVLRSGEFLTPTTKNRINDALSLHTPGLGISQEDGVWFLVRMGEAGVVGRWVFKDGITIRTANGFPVIRETAGAFVDMAAVRKWKREAKKKAAEIADAAVAGWLDARNKEGLPVVRKAQERFGVFPEVLQQRFTALHSPPERADEATYLDELLRKHIASIVYRYLCSIEVTVGK